MKLDLTERLWRALSTWGFAPHTPALGRRPKPRSISRTKERGIWAGMICVVASGAAADMVCTFETECFDGEACGESGFVVRLSGDAMETDFGTYPVQDLNGAFYALGDGAHYLLTTGESAARLSVHMEGPMVVSYLGRCE